MKDLAQLAKAVVCPYLALFYGSLAGLLSFSGEEVPAFILVVFIGALGELGFEFGIKKVRRK